MPRSFVGRATTVAVLAAGVVVSQALPVWAGAFTSPAATAQHPFVVPVNAKGAPVPFTIMGSGWKPNMQVYVEVCDGVSPQSQSWMPTIDCDEETEPARAIANAKGQVVWPATNTNFQIAVFRGASPQGLFNCLSANQPDPHNDLRSFQNCQIRMTDNDTVASVTDAFLPIELPNLTASQAAAAASASSTTAGAPAASSATGKAATASGGTSTSTKSNKGPLASTGAKIALLVAVGLAAIAAGYFLVVLSRRRRAQTPPI